MYLRAMLHAPSPRAYVPPFLSRTASRVVALACGAAIGLMSAPSGANAQVVTDASLGSMMVYTGPAFAVRSSFWP